MCYSCMGVVVIMMMQSKTWVGGYLIISSKRMCKGPFKMIDTLLSVQLIKLATQIQKQQGKDKESIVTTRHNNYKKITVVKLSTVAC